MRSLPLLLALATFSLVGLFYLLKPVAPGNRAAAVPPPAATAAREDGTPSASASAATTPSPQVVESAEPDPVRARFEIRDGQRLSGPDRVEAMQGQVLRIEVLSDRDDELHLHGYDRHQPVAAGIPAVLQFTATHSGRFELELHNSHLTLTAIEVQPN